MNRFQGRCREKEPLKKGRIKILNVMDQGRNVKGEGGKKKKRERGTLNSGDRVKRNVGTEERFSRDRANEKETTGSSIILGIIGRNYEKDRGTVPLSKRNQRIGGWGVPDNL